MSGWFGYGRVHGVGEETPSDPAYSRVTNPERFGPLHPAMLAIIDRLESDFDVEREEKFGLDEELERGLDLARGDVRLTPRDPDAAPIAVAFTAFPGLRLRFGRWYIEPFPDCGCDACDESVEGEVEQLRNMVDDVIAGRFRESIEIPLISFRGSGWVHTRFWSPDGRRAIRGSRVDRGRAREMSGGQRRLELNWKPWTLRQLAAHGRPSAGSNPSVERNSVPGVSPSRQTKPTEHVEQAATSEIVAVLISPNPPKDTDGRREESGRGVRELQGK